MYGKQKQIKRKAKLISFVYRCIQYVMKYKTINTPTFFKININIQYMSDFMYIMSML